MTLKLPPVVSDITGVTGRAILQAILAGERDPQRLAKLRHPHGHHTEDDSAKALQGTWRAEHRLALRQAVELYAFSHQQSAQGDQQSTAHLETLRAKSAGQPWPPKARRHKPTNAPRFDARPPCIAWRVSPGPPSRGSQKAPPGASSAKSARPGTGGQA
jgi:transposase